MIIAVVVKVGVITTWVVARSAPTTVSTPPEISFSEGAGQTGNVAGLIARADGGRRGPEIGDGESIGHRLGPDLAPGEEIYEDLGARCRQHGVRSDTSCECR